MSQDSPLVEFEVERGLCVFRFTENVDPANFHDAVNWISATVEAERPPCVILNLDNLDYIQSVGVGKLLTLNTNVTALGGQLCLCKLSEGVERVISASRVTVLIEVFDSEEAARKYWRQRETAQLCEEAKAIANRQQETLGENSGVDRASFPLKVESTPEHIPYSRLLTDVLYRHSKLLAAAVVTVVIVWLLALFSRSPPLIETVPVSGRVTSRGEPVEGVKVSFEPTARDKTTVTQPSSYGLTDANGWFELEWREGIGAVTGKHRVILVSTQAASYEVGSPKSPVGQIEKEASFVLPINARDGTILLDVPAGGTNSAHFHFP